MNKNIPSNWHLDGETIQDSLRDVNCIESFHHFKILLKYAKGKSLEVGSGTGKFSEGLSLHGVDAYCIDFENSCLQGTRIISGKCNADVKCVKGDILKILFSDNTFDLTFNDGTIEHFLNDSIHTVIDEMYKVTKPGGYCVIFVPNTQSPLLRRKYEIVTNEYVIFGHDGCKVPERIISLSELKSLTEQSSFEVVEKGYISHANRIFKSPNFLRDFYGSIFGWNIYVVGRKR